MNLPRTWRVTGKLALAFLINLALSPSVIFAQGGATTPPPQQESSSRPRTQDDSAGKDTGQNQDSSNPTGSAQSTPGGLPTPPVSQIGRATPLPRVAHAFGWGGLYLGSLEYVQVFQQLSGFSGIAPLSVNGAPVPADTTASIIEPTLVFDRQLHRGRFTLQYQPQIAVIGGQLVTDFYNQQASLDTSFAINEKWSIALGDEFSFLGNRDLSLFLDSYYSVDFANGNSAQNFFLTGPSRLVSDSAHFGVTYQANARNRISVTPMFTYIYTSPQGPFSANSSHLYDVTTDFDHVVSSRTTVGLFYSSEYSQFQQTFQNTFFQSFGGSLSHQLGRSWRVYGTIGASTAQVFRSQPTRWTSVGNIGFLKSFRRSSLAFSYDRGYTFAGYVSNAYYDRADAVYNRQLSRRVALELGGGYYGEVDSPSKIRGEYGISRLDFRLLSQLTWFTSYSYQSQVGSSSQVSAGRRNSVQTGLIWTPGTTAR